MKKIYLVLILLLTVFLRFNNLNWDSNFHLHPDERFLTMVGNAMKVPSNATEYFDPQVSNLNPQNVGFKFYVYGTFPVVLNKIIAVVVRNDNYNAFTIQGRFLAALADLIIVLLVFKTLDHLIGPKAKKMNPGGSRSLALWGAFFYAIAVLPMQHAHFFVIDPFLNLFMFVSFYLALRKRFALSAVFFGLALASKVTAIFILPLIAYFLWEKRRLQPILIFIFVAYLSVRVASPYYFQSANLFDITPNQAFLENLKTLKAFEGENIWYPPAVQWVNKTPLIFSLKNLAIFGLGLSSFILTIIGASYALFKVKSLTFNIILLWVILFFLYQSTRFAQPMRYFLFLYPFLAIFAAYGSVVTIRWVSEQRGAPPQPSKASEDGAVVRTGPIELLFIGILLIWPLAFSSIYLNKNSRVEASDWIYKNLEDKSFILSEHWDDPLPLGVPNSYGKTFISKQLLVFDQDTDEKWIKMKELLDKGDYYILSSNRGWGSITTVPEKYPRMNKFYENLLAGKTQYKKIAEFASYPKLCLFKVGCLTLNDSLADESFTVYDHPKVLIFKKN